MSVLVVYITWKSLLSDELDLLYKDNLIKCDTILKNKNIFILMYYLIKFVLNINLLIIFKFTNLI